MALPANSSASIAAMPAREARSFLVSLEVIIWSLLN